MKKILLATVGFVMFTATSIIAQDGNSGIVTYEETIKIEIKLEGEMAHLMKDMPKERKSEKLLYFSPSASLFTNPPAGDDHAEAMEGSGIRIMMSTPENKLFADLETGEVIEQREFMTRMFLINGEMPASDWKITGEQKMILDYPCMEATRTDTAGKVTRIWFAPTLPVKSGPANYINLPGMVLEVDIDEGSHHILAKSISFEKPPKEMLAKPKDGKKVTRQEFDEIVAEKMKEMGGEGGGGTFMIRVRH